MSDDDVRFTLTQGRRSVYGALLSGDRDPTDVDGLAGDVWFRTDTSQVWGPRTPAGEWGEPRAMGTGEQGPQGEPGEPGEQGEQGEQGPQGEPGESGAGAPAGASGEVTYNDSDVAAGAGGILYDKTLVATRLGSDCLVTGLYSLAAGLSSEALNNQAFAMGRSCSAFGLNSQAVGEDTVAYGYCSSSAGFDTQAHGSFSHAIGHQTQAAETCTLAIGLRAMSSHPGQIASSAGGVGWSGSSQVTSACPIFASTPGTAANEIVVLGPVWAYLEDGKAYAFTIEACVAAVIEEVRLTARLRRSGIASKTGGVVTVTVDGDTEVVSASALADDFVLGISSSEPNFGTGAGVVARCHVIGNITIQEVAFPDASVTEISGLALDLDAQLGVALTSSKVSTWTDQVSGYTFTQGTAGARPTVVTDDLDWRALRFDGVDDVLTQTGSTLADLIASNAFTVFVVHRNVTSGTNETDAIANAALIADSGGNFGIAVKDDTDIIARCFSKDTLGVQTSEHVICSGAGNHTAIGISSFEHRAGTLFSQLNTGNGPLRTVLADAGNTLSLAGALNVGANHDGSAFVGADVLRILVFNRVLTIAERYNAIGMLNAQYGAANLDAPLTPSEAFGANLKRHYLENYDDATGTYVDETGTENAVLGLDRRASGDLRQDLRR